MKDGWGLSVHLCVTSTLSCVGEDEVDEFSCLLDDELEEDSSTLRTRWANFSELMDSLMLAGRGDTWDGGQKGE